MRILEITPTSLKKSMRRLTYLPALLAMLFLAGAQAQAETVKGTFRYLDSDGTRRPIKFAKVEVWRFAPRFLGIWGWANDATITTDGQGKISKPMPFVTSGVIYGVKVFATNSAAVVWPFNQPFTQPFYQEPGQPDGAIINKTAFSPGDVLIFDYDFQDSWTPQHYNLADVLRHGFEYATARRDLRETDPIPPVNVQPTSLSPTGTFYNPVNDTLIIDTSHVFEDFVILHEYAHYLEDQISSFLPMPSYHYGCEARDPFGNLINSPELAWMEAFAAYFAQSVALLTPQGELNGTIGRNTPSMSELENPAACTVAPPDTIEDFVSATLWDLFDNYFDPQSHLESHDLLTRQDFAIFQILDREMDLSGRYPNIWDLRNAWKARGLNLEGLDRILIKHHILEPRLADDIVLTGPSSWNTMPTAFSNRDGSFTVKNQPVGIFAACSSDPSVSRLVGDFNGDGRADIALTGVPGWNTIPVAFSNGDGIYRVTNLFIGTFASWSADPRVSRLVGDFNWDGKADIALTGVPGWNTIPIAFSNGDGSFRVTNNFVGDFATWSANTQAAKLVGDFNGDGKADIALVGIAGIETLPVAQSIGNGSFIVTNQYVGNFAASAADSRAAKLTGDFDGDGRTDIALTGVPGWNTMPVAFARDNGEFIPINPPVGDFAIWSTDSNVTRLVADFNGDGASDIALTGGAGWQSIPVAFFDFQGGFAVTNKFVGDFASWASTQATTKLVGDFNRDGKADIAVTGGAGWNTLPVAFSNGDGGFAVTNKYAGDFAAWSADPQARKLIGVFKDRKTDP